MKKIFLVSIFLLGGILSASEASAAGQGVVLSCGSYSGTPAPTNATCDASVPRFNSNAYTNTGFKCCMTQANSDKLNADVATITKNGYTIVKAGGNTSSLTSPQVALTTPYKATTAPAPGGSTPPPGNGACASPNACRSTKCNANETTASGSCPNSGVCCAPAGSGTTAPAGGGPTAGTNTVIEITNPLQYDTVEGVLSQVMSALRNIVVILALVFLVIGGLMYITSAGNDKRISAAKACVTAALVGLVIVMAAPSFLKEIGSVLGWNEAASTPGLTISEIARKVLNFLLGIIGIIAIIMFLVGSVMYLTSAGDEKRAGTAKNVVKYAIIGLIVAFSALVLVTQLASFFA